MTSSAPRSRTIETGRGPVEYSEAGSGIPVLYFHGTGIRGEAMMPVESRMVEDGIRLIVPNRPGYGATPLSPHKTAEGCAQVMDAFLDSLGIGEVSVMGSSGGATFAASFAVQHPDRVTSLVLLCPQLHRWDHKRWLPRSSRWTLPLLKRSLLRRLLVRLYRFQLRRMDAGRLLKIEAGERYAEVAANPAALELCGSALDAMVQGTRYDGFQNDFLVFLNEDLFAGGRTIRPPTLLIHDECDPLAPVGHVEWFLSRVPHGQRVSIHAAGHLIWVGPEADRMHRARMQFVWDHKGGAWN